MEWLKRSQSAFDTSSAWIETNWRADWDYSLRAFRNEHASNSKYHSPEYQYRSRLFRPKTRSIIRKNEAAGAVALFSNMEVINVTPGNPDDLQNVASAAAIKEVLEYRLTKTLPTFPLVMGALQDAQTVGVVVSYQYWDYRVNGDEKIDKPCVELRPIENIRIDGGADWLDPINTSPYLFDIIPMYVCDVKGMMKAKDDKTGQPKWKTYDDKTILKAKPDRIDQIRKARLGKQQDPEQEDSDISEFDLVWVIRCFMKDDQGKDYTYYMLGTEELLTDPKPIKEVYFTGKRPYVMGYAVIETHKPIKTGLPMLVKPLQQETNQLQNSRLDNVQLVLNKRFYVRRGSQTDIGSLNRNAAGGVTLTTNPKEDIIEANWTDVTSSAYVEQDRINADLDELAGNFSPSTKVANNAVNDTLGGSKMASQGAGMMTDYLLRTFIETWWEPVLRQLVMLEAEYETDEVILQVCANKARLFPRFRYTSITDDMLKADVGITVNVGMGSTDPRQRQQNFLSAAQAVLKLQALSAQFPAFNVMEASKEIFSNAGYRDGERFINQRVDPQVAMLKQQLQKMAQALNGKQMELQSKEKIEQMKVMAGDRQSQAQIATDRGRISGDLQIRQSEIASEQQVNAAQIALDRERLELEKLQLQVEIQGRSEEFRMRIAELGSNIEQAHMKLEGERQKIMAVLAKSAVELETAQLDLQTQKAAAANESKVVEVAGKVSESMNAVHKKIKEMASEVESAKSDVSGVKDQLQQHGQALALTLHGIASGQGKRPKSMKKKKDGTGRMVAITVVNHDGSEEEMPVE